MNNPKVSEEGIAMRQEFDMPCRESQIAALHETIATLRHTNDTLTRTIAIQVETLATLRAEATKAAEELSYAKAGAMCPCCLGNPISGKPCICGGSNDAHDAYTNCVRELLKTEADLARERELVRDLRQLLKQVRPLVSTAANGVMAFLTTHYSKMLEQIDALLEPKLPEPADTPIEEK